MKLGPLYITWRTSKEELELRSHVLLYLRTGELPRDLITKMARSEVKNYMAALAEEADIPFGDPASFIAVIRHHLSEISTTNLAEPPDNPLDDDPPYTVITERRVK